MNFRFLALFLLVAAVARGQAAVKKIESKPFVLGITDKIESSVLMEPRVLNIYLPDAYAKNDTTTYPVIYLLDGSADEDFVHIVGLVQFLTMIQAMPNSIVVGIGNMDRKRDFTFPSKVKKDVDLVPTSGGSAKFIDFLEQELQPYIRKNYRVNNNRTLIGQSLGGLVATEILLKKPHLFNNYIIVSPSLWWNKESLLADAPGLLKQHPPGDMNVYISVGSEGKQMEGDAGKLVHILKSSNGKNAKVLYAPLPKETHLTILHNSVYNAFVLLNKK